MNIHKTRGIVLHYFDYSETSIIVKVYTESFGLESFIIKAVRKNKSKTKLSLFQHLSLLDMVVYHNEKAGLQNIKEIKSSYKFSSLPFDIKKSSIALFINEIIYKSIKEETPNIELFDFIYNSVIHLDQIEENYSDFHIHFLIELTKYLGFFPVSNYSDNDNFFNLKEGLFQPFYANEEFCIPDDLSKVFSVLLNNKFGEYYVPVELRKDLIKYIIRYYSFHVSGLNEVKSFNILETVFN